MGLNFQHRPQLTHHQEHPPGSPAGRGCPAVQGSHTESSEANISRVLQPAVPGTKEDRGSASRHRSVCIESSHGGAALENGNTGVRSSSHQEARMDCIHRHKRCLAPCPNAQGRQKVPAIQSEHEDLPVHLSTFREFTKLLRPVVAWLRRQSVKLHNWLIHTVSRTGPDAFQDDHRATPEARMGYQLREVRPNTKPGLPVSGNAFQPCWAWWCSWQR